MFSLEIKELSSDVVALLCLVSFTELMYTVVHVTCIAGTGTCITVCSGIVSSMTYH